MMNRVLVVGLAAGLASSAVAQPFSIIVLPDTQNYSNNASNAPLFTQQTQWIADQVQGTNPDNIVFVTHIGDVVSSGDNPTQIARSNASLSVLDGGLADSIIPWSVLPGNHDFADTGNKSTGTDDYVDAFGPSRFQGKTWFGGGDPSGNNTYQFFEGAGQTYLHVALEWQPTVNVTNGPTRDPSPIAWAQSIHSANPGLPTIISTHEHVDDSPPGRSGAGEALWNELIRKNDQIIMVLNGHFHSSSVPTNDGEYHQVSVNDFGNNVIEVLQDYQDYPNGGDGWLRIVTFDPAQGNVRFQTFSPVLDQFQTETVAQVGQFASDFTLPVDYTFDFADPPEPPVDVFQTITFQQGLDGYDGTEDKEIRSLGGDGSNGNAASISVDGDDGSPGAQPNQGLIRFNNIVGTGDGQLAPGSTVDDAQLVLNITNPGSGFELFRMTTSWDESTTWQDLGGNGVTPGVDAQANSFNAVGANNSSSNVGSGTLTIGMNNAVNAWLAGASNEGIALVPFPNGSNGIDFDSSEGNVPPALVIRSLLPGITRQVFRQGLDGYTGTQDAELRQAQPASNFGSNTSVSVDSDDPSGSGNDNHVLLRFDDIFTEADGEVIRATLTLNGFNPGDGGTFHRMLVDWDESDATWNSLGSGVTPNDAEAVFTPDAAAAGGTGAVEVDVTLSIQAWLDDPSSNFGWAILPTGSNGWDFDTSESAANSRPTLEIFFVEAGDPNCNPADLAAPFGLLDLSDVDAFIGAFVNGGAAADIAPPQGVIDLSDVDAFIGAFVAGCL